MSHEGTECASFMLGQLPLSKRKLLAECPKLEEKRTPIRNSGTSALSQ